MKYLLIILVFMQINLFAQLQKDVLLYNKDFIGKTFEQVNEYWSGKISDEYFKELGTTFLIMDGNVGASQFSARFKDDKCYEQDIQLTHKTYSVFLAKLKQDGFFYDKKLDAYINKAKKRSWKVNNVSDWHEATLNIL